MSLLRRLRERFQGRHHLRRFSHEKAKAVARGRRHAPIPQLERLRTRLIEGGVLGRLISDVEALPLATRKLLVAAEKSGDLETAFSQLAADMAELVDRRTQRLLAFLEPLLIVGMFLFIGGMVLAIMIPMLSATSAAAF